MVERFDLHEQALAGIFRECLGSIELSRHPRTDPNFVAGSLRFSSRGRKRRAEQRASLLGARTLLGAAGIATRNKKLLGAPTKLTAPTERFASGPGAHIDEGAALGPGISAGAAVPSVEQSASGELDLVKKRIWDC